MNTQEVTRKIHGWIADKDPNFTWFRKLGWPEDLTSRDSFDLIDREGNRFIVVVIESKGK